MAGAWSRQSWSPCVEHARCMTPSGLWVLVWRPSNGAPRRFGHGWSVMRGEASDPCRGGALLCQSREGKGTMGKDDRWAPLSAARGG